MYNTIIIFFFKLGAPIFFSLTVYYIKPPETAPWIACISNTVARWTYYWCPQKCEIIMVLYNCLLIQYCNSNKGHFSIASHWIIALNLFASFVLSVFFASFLYCSFYWYRFPNYCYSGCCCSLLLLKAIAKSFPLLFFIAFKREKIDNYCCCNSCMTLNMKQYNNEA